MGDAASTLGGAVIGIVDQLEALPNELPGVNLTRGPRQVTNGNAYACALVAQECYREYADRAYELVDHEGDRWTKWTSLTSAQDRTIAVYTYRNKFCIIGFRGTKDSTDYFADVDVFIDAPLKFNTRFDDASSFVGEFLRKNSKLKTYVTGHSLGGFIAFICAERHSELTAHLFNAGGGGLFHSMSGHRQIPDRATHHHIRGDTISAGFSRILAHRNDYNCCESSAHTIKNFILPEHQRS